jgi:putative membrane protein
VDTNPYERFRGKELTLSDYLAIDRTILANERTALANGRTFLAMIIIGGSLIKFFDTWIMWILGVAFLAASVLLIGNGWHRFRRTQRFLAVALERRTETPAPAPTSAAGENPRPNTAGAAAPAPLQHA